MKLATRLTRCALGAALAALLAGSVGLQFATLARADTASGSGFGSEVSDSGGSSDSGSAYVLHSGDSLNITVLGHDELATKTPLTILPDGYITFPYAGRVHAAGMTTDELAAALDKRLVVECNNPQANVTVVSMNTPHANVVGSAHSPGPKDVHPGDRVLTLIADAGGIDGDPALMQGTLVTKQGAVSQIDVAGIMTGTDPAANVLVHPDDILLLTPRPTTFDEIQVSGEVEKPGSLHIPVTGEPLLQALSDAGGPKADAGLSHAQIMHNGTPTVVDLRSINTSLNSSVANRMLVPGDLLLIPVDDAKIAVLGGVRNANTYVIPDGQTLTVADAVALAGGTMLDAEMQKSAVLRKNPSGGPPEQIYVNVDPLAGTNQKSAKVGNGTTPDSPALASEVFLKPGDVVYVPEKGPKGNGSSFLNSVGALGGLIFGLGGLL